MEELRALTVIIMLVSAISMRIVEEGTLAYFVILSIWFVAFLFWLLSWFVKG